MARCALRWRSYWASALCVIAVLNVAFLVFLHTHRPLDETSPAKSNVIESNHAESSTRGLAASKMLQGLEALGRRRSSNYGMASNNVDGDLCRNLTRDSVGIPSSAEEMTEETFQWQTVGRELKETFVFSAFHDGRVTPGVVRIIGISSGKYVGAEKQTKHCQLWLPNKMHPKVTLAEYNIVPETHDRSYAASLHICRLENLQGDIPYAVSLVNDECQSPSNVLRVLNYNNDVQSPTEFNFTVCVTPLNFNYDNYHQLVEMVEVNRLFGAQRFVFYNYSTGNQLEPYLRWYEARAVLQVIPWHPPVVVDVWPEDPKVEPEIHYFGQLAALNDCLYRSMLSSRFVVFTDLDELIVPRRNDTWLQMLSSSITGTLKQQQQQRRTDRSRLLTPGAFVFRNVFFRTDWNDSSPEGANLSSLAVPLQLNTLLKMTREERIYPPYVRSKYIAVAKMASMVGVHSVLNFIDDANLTHVMVDADDGLLHHYRRWMDDDVTTPVADDRMQRFAKEIISAADYVHSHVLRQSNNAKSK